MYEVVWQQSPPPFGGKSPTSAAGQLGTLICMQENPDVIPLKVSLPTRLLVLTRVCPSNISLGSAIFAQLMIVSNTPTHRHVCSSKL